jgi:transcriptional regulator with XRE-family HTH domain
VNGQQPKPPLTISGFTPECVVMDGFSERLKAARESRGLSQVRFAEMIGVLPRVYNRWEKGGVTPRFDTVVKMAEVLAVSLDELAGKKPASSSDVRVHDPRLHELYKEVDRLSPDDQQALAILLDSLVKRSQMARLLAS